MCHIIFKSGLGEFIFFFIFHHNLAINKMCISRNRNCSYFIGNIVYYYTDSLFSWLLHFIMILHIKIKASVATPVEIDITTLGPQGSRPWLPLAVLFLAPATMGTFVVIGWPIYCISRDQWRLCDVTNPEAWQPIRIEEDSVVNRRTLAPDHIGRVLLLSCFLRLSLPCRMPLVAHPACLISLFRRLRLSFCFGFCQETHHGVVPRHAPSALRLARYVLFTRTAIYILLA